MDHQENFGSDLVNCPTAMTVPFKIMNSKGRSKIAD
jgi:hypothetical protein